MSARNKVTPTASPTRCGIWPEDLGGMTASCDPRLSLRSSPFNTNCHSKNRQCVWALLKQAIVFDILKNASASTDKASYLSVLRLCLLLYLSSNFALQDTQDQRLCRPQRKLEVEYSSKTKKGYTQVVHSNYTFHTHFPCGDITMLYLLWPVATC